MLGKYTQGNFSNAPAGIQTFTEGEFRVRATSMVDCDCCEGADDFNCTIFTYGNCQYVNTFCSLRKAPIILDPEGP